jgi:hypothetical protein
MGEKQGNYLGRIKAAPTTDADDEIGFERFADLDSRCDAFDRQFGGHAGEDPGLNSNGRNSSHQLRKYGVGSQPFVRDHQCTPPGLGRELRQRFPLAGTKDDISG